MSLNEVLTCVRENIPAIAVVFNNGQWGAEKKNQVCDKYCIDLFNISKRYSSYYFINDTRDMCTAVNTENKQKFLMN